jgi:hypothetical protein
MYRGKKFTSKMETMQVAPAPARMLRLPDLQSTSHCRTLARPIAIDVHIKHLILNCAFVHRFVYGGGLGGRGGGGASMCACAHIHV